MTVSEYNKCVDLFSDGVFRFVVKNIRDRQAAEDIVQDVFEKMWLKRDGIDGEKAKSYLFTSAYHTLIDYQRKNSKLSSITKHTPMENDFNAYSDLKELLNVGIEKLPEDQKAVLLLRDYEGYSYEEIGEITGLSESQVKVYIYRARLFLKEFIGKMEVLI